MTTTKYEIK